MKIDGVDIMEDPIVHQFLECCKSMVGKGVIKTIYLFGSRAKGTARPDSDYDFLVVVSDAFSLHDKDALYDQVIDILLESGRLVSLKLFREGVFRRLCDMRTPFTSHVLKEGVRVG